PGRINPPQEPLGFRRAGFSPALSLLVPALSLPLRPAVLAVGLRPIAECSPTAQQVSLLSSQLRSRACAASNCPRRIACPVSCYALLQGWVPISTAPGCRSD